MISGRRKTNAFNIIALVIVIANFRAPCQYWMVQAFYLWCRQTDHCIDLPEA